MYVGRLMSRLQHLKADYSPEEIHELAEAVALGSRLRLKRSDSYSPWQGKRNYSPWMGKRSGIVATTADSSEEDVPDVPRPKKFLPWAGKRSGEQLSPIGSR